MMNSLSSEEAPVFTVPVKTYLYRDMGDPGGSHERESRRSDGDTAPRGPTPQQIEELMNRARNEAIAETEARLKLAYEARIEAQALKIRRAIEEFNDGQKTYFTRVEAEVVQLALAIAAKILHREAQVDPLLVAALVRVAVDKLHDSSSVSVRVSPTAAGKWRGVFSHPSHGSTIQIVEDPDLGVDDCVLETELGSANFSLNAQLKEVEQGFFDLLAQRPVTQ